jgi:threonine/homoserine/homoserine lactone efflux protein
MGVMSVISVGTSFTTGEKIAFFAGILTTDFIANLIKAFLSGKVVKYVKPHYLQYVNRVAGVSMVIFGLRLLYQTFFV